MITIDDILSSAQTLKAKINEFYASIVGAVADDATLDDLTSNSKTSEYNKWMYVFSGVSVIVDSVWLQRYLNMQLLREGIKARIVFAYDVFVPGDFIDTIHPSVPSPVTDITGYNKIGVRVWPALRLVAGYTN
jgi:hypothetical protein